MRESWNDRNQESEDDDLHRNDTVQEKLSLAARFGCSIGYFKPNKKEYNNIVKTLAQKYPEITLNEKELELEANKWEIAHGGFSGRTAQQFINYLVGKNGE